MFRRLRSVSLPSLATLVVAVSAAIAPRGWLKAAEPPSSAKYGKATVVQLNVDPAAEPVPALKYTLLVPSTERKPGNAVPFYYRAILAYATSQPANQGMDKRIEEWMSAPLATFPRDAVRKALGGFRTFDELREATSREECNWDWRLQEVLGVKSFEFLLDEVQRSRGLVRWLAVKARLEIAEGRYDDAVDTLRIGYQMAHDFGKTQILITSLVGMAINSTMDEQVHAFMEAPNSPNLYWALTELPRPLTECRQAIEFEMNYPKRVFPFLKDPEHAEHSALQWADLLTEAFGTLNRLSAENWASQTQSAGWRERLVATGQALRGYTKAKRDLIAAGYNAAKVEEMPVGQVIAIDEARICRYVCDEMRKWTLIPYPEGGRRMQSTGVALGRLGFLGRPDNGREVLPVISILLPAIESIGDAMSRRETSTAADRVIEAIRMQASQNGGKLPASLAHVTVVPVPDDPRTGKPFPYTVEGNTATLEVRRGSQAPQPFEPHDLVYEISIAHDRHGSPAGAGQ